jgi:hypothetical protein
MNQIGVDRAFEVDGLNAQHGCGWLGGAAVGAREERARLRLADLDGTDVEGTVSTYEHRLSILRGERKEGGGGGSCAVAR